MFRSTFLADTVCFKEIGCFSNSGPFSKNRPINALPDSPESINIQFYLYTRSNPLSPQILKINDKELLSKSNFVGSKETKLIIHGYGSWSNKTWVKQTIAELLKHDDYNVIAVDWKSGARTLYPQAASNTRVVGAQTSLLINLLRNVMGAKPQKMHLIGHSLGAHVAGYTGKRQSKLGRITGLDPAGPYFESTQPIVRLDRADAHFVDIVHTDTGGLFDFALGIQESIGHIDVYANGGEYQPGCTSSKIPGTIISGIWNLLDNMGKDARKTFLCSHRRAEGFFIESINTKCPFHTYSCQNYSQLEKGNCLAKTDMGRLGFHSDKAPGRGIHILKTFADAPYCGYHYRLNISGLSNIVGKIFVTLKGTKGESQVANVVGKHSQLLAHSIHFVPLFLVHEDIGDLESIVVSYVETNRLIGFLFNNNWKLESLTVFSGETHKLYKFCVKNAVIKSRSSRTFQVSDECTDM